MEPSELISSEMIPSVTLQESDNMLLSEPVSSGGVVSSTTERHLSEVGKQYSLPMDRSVLLGDT